MTSHHGWQQISDQDKRELLDNVINLRMSFSDLKEEAMLRYKSDRTRNLLVLRCSALLKEKYTVQDVPSAFHPFMDKDLTVKDLIVSVLRNPFFSSPFVLIIMCVSEFVNVISPYHTTGNNIMIHCSPLR